MRARRGARQAKRKPASAGLLTRRELAAARGVHMQTVTKWEQDGMPVAERGRAGKPSRYRQRDVNAWLKAREKKADQSGMAFVAQERARKERAQAVLAEQTFQMRAGTLIAADEVEKAWAAEVAAVRAKLLAWPSTVADQLFRAATLEGLPGVEHVLLVAVHDVLGELSSPHADRRKGAA